MSFRAKKKVTDNRSYPEQRAKLMLNTRIEAHVSTSSSSASSLPRFCSSCIQSSLSSAKEQTPSTSRRLPRTWTSCFSQSTKYVHSQNRVSFSKSVESMRCLREPSRMRGKDAAPCTLRRRQYQSLGCWPPTLKSANPAST